MERWATSLFVLVAGEEGSEVAVLLDYWGDDACEEVLRAHSLRSGGRIRVCWGSLRRKTGSLSAGILTDRRARL